MLCRGNAKAVEKCDLTWQLLGKMRLLEETLRLGRGYDHWSVCGGGWALIHFGIRETEECRHPLDHILRRKLQFTGKITDVETKTLIFTSAFTSSSEGLHRSCSR